MLLLLLCSGTVKHAAITSSVPLLVWFLSSLYQEEFQLHADELLQSRQHLLNQPKDYKHELIYGADWTQIHKDSTQQPENWNTNSDLFEMKKRLKKKRNTEVEFLPALT